MAGGGANSGGEVLFEVRRIGATLRVAAIDPVRNLEVVVFGPAAAEAALRQLARRKLDRALLQHSPGTRR